MRVSAGLAVIGLSGKTRIQTLPPRFIKRVSAIRAASIWRASSQTGSSACKPYSPKASVLPRWAVPFMRPRCCLRYFVRDGANNMASYLLYWLSLCPGFRLGGGRFLRLRGYLLNLDLRRLCNLWCFHDRSGFADRCFRTCSLRYSGLTLRARAALAAFSLRALATFSLCLTLRTRAALAAFSLRALATLSLCLTLRGFTLRLALRALAAFSLRALATLSLRALTTLSLRLTLRAWRSLSLRALAALAALTTLATLTALTATLATFAALALAWEGRLRSEFGSFCCRQALAGQHIALINPYFDTDNAKGGMRLCLAVSISARRVCRGTFPSTSFSERAISAPPRRPPTIIFTPFAPARNAFCTACFMARRKATRFSSCSAILRPTRVASSSGWRISRMFRRTRLWVFASSSARSRSTFSPLLPMTMPGRAV